VKPSRRICFPEGLEEDSRTSAHLNELRLLHRILMDLYNRGEPLSSMTSTPPLRRSDFVRTTPLEPYRGVRRGPLPRWLTKKALRTAKSETYICMQCHPSVGLDKPRHSSFR
jgi:hypothetical protein